MKLPSYVAAAKVFFGIQPSILLILLEIGCTRLYITIRLE
jgi:hypothetical protein